MKFIDRAKIIIMSGRGGNGIVSFSKGLRGVADGGHGGRGGHIYLAGTHAINSLADFRMGAKIKAGNGGSGGHNKMFGRSGKDKFIMLPIGTEVRNSVGDLIFDVMDTVPSLALRGGKGGVGNSAFKSSTNRSPQQAIQGHNGAELEIFMQLKLLADVCLIGMPNAGKSSLISLISNCKSRIGTYAFTTYHPHIGTVVYDYNPFTVIDLPGIIEGASIGKGNGINILGHCERCSVILHVIDSSLESAHKNYYSTWDELKAYPGCDFEKKQEIVILNKSDICKIDAQSFYNATGKKAISISCKNNASIGYLIKQLYDTISTVRQCNE